MTWPWILAAVVVVVLVGLWLSWTANRLDRLHHRVDLSRATLTAALLHRSAAALDLATSGVLDPARSLLLLDAAQRARVAGVDVEPAESDLSETLRAVFADTDDVQMLRAGPAAGELLVELAGACAKVELARRFHNSAVVAARTLRARRRVRWLHLAGRAGPLETIDLDDVPPAALLAG